MFTFKPTLGAVNEYRPILVPFIKRRFGSDEKALRALVEHMAKFIFAELSTICENPETSLDPLGNFLARLRREHVTRIYTTTTMISCCKAAPDLYTGFADPPSSGAKRFDLKHSGRPRMQMASSTCTARSTWVFLARHRPIRTWAPCTGSTTEPRP